MNKKIAFVPLLALSGLMSLSACGGGKQRSGSEDTIYVCVFDGGYGTDWIKTIAEDYERDTGIHVEWDADQSILVRLTSELKNPSYDIYMSHDITWQQYAAQGLLENLDSLYSDTVEGTNKTFKQRLCPGAEEVSKYDGHYYKVCYTRGAGGLVYNMDMFEANGWTVPTTYDELMQLCKDIVAADISVGLDTVVPIAWSGDREYYWDYIVYEWWAQLGGEATVNKFKEFKGDDGKYSTGYEVYNPSTNYKEFMQAYELYRNLIAVSENHSFSNTDPQNAPLVTAQSLFMNGKAAMIPYAQWAKWEIQNATSSTFKFDIAMMKTPRVNNQVTTDYNYNVGFGDSMIIPSKAPSTNKEMAKEFVKYLSKPAACKTFVEKARGAFLAFDYSIVDLGELLNDTYINSIYHKLTDCTNFNIVSNNPISYVNTGVMPWIDNKYYYAKSFAFPNDNEYKTATVGQTIYQYAKNNWENWMKRAGLKD